VSETPPDLAILRELLPGPIEPLWRRLAMELATAAASGRHPLHLVVVASLDARGGAAARTVVLRGFDEAARLASFHTDRRSPKLAGLARDPRLTLLWYDEPSRLQIRIPAEATIHHADRVARDAWEAAAAMSRACYASQHAPGEELTRPTPAPSPHDPENGFDNFAVVCCRFRAVELLALDAAGHRRRRIEFAGQTPQGAWLAP